MKTAWLLCTVFAFATAAEAAEPLRVGMIGLVHGHSRGLFERLNNRTDVKLVGVAEPNDTLWGQHITKFKLDSSVFYKSTEQMLDKAKPEAVVVYTSTLDHLAAVKACAARKIPVMMEKPLAVDLQAAKE